MKITISKSDKFNLPNVYESSGLGFSMEFEIPDGLSPEEISKWVQHAKQ